jgi:hypothetical protein
LDRKLPCLRDEKARQVILDLSNHEVSMRKNLLIAGVVFAAPLLWGSAVPAAIVTFVGQDDGAPVGGPFPNSSAAQASFEAAAAAFGTLNTIAYENLAVGFYSPIAAAPGVSISLSAPQLRQRLLRDQ